MEEIYSIGPYTFTLVITRRKTKSITIRVRDEKLNISCSPYVSKAKIYELINNNKEKLYKMLNTQKINNEIHIFGKSYNVIIIEDKINKIEISEYNLIIHTKNVDNSYIEKQISEFYKELLIPVVNQYVLEAKYIYNPFPTIKYKNMKSMFGNYKKSTNTITLSTKLAKYDYIYIKTTLYHELTHSLVMNHGPLFYKEFEKVFPNCKKIQHSLKMLRYKDLF